MVEIRLLLKNPDNVWVKLKTCLYVLLSVLGALASIIGLYFTISEYVIAPNEPSYFKVPNTDNEDLLQDTPNIGNSPASVRTLSTIVDDRGPALRFRVESLLDDLGYFDGVPSGEETLDSREAIRQAEIELGLDVDGQPDLKLLRVLESRKRGS